MVEVRSVFSDDLAHYHGYSQFCNTHSFPISHISADECRAPQQSLAFVSHRTSIYLVVGNAIQQIWLVTPLMLVTGLGVLVLIALCQTPSKPQDLDEVIPLVAGDSVTQ